MLFCYHSAEYYSDNCCSTANLLSVILLSSVLLIIVLSICLSLECHSAQCRYVKCHDAIENDATIILLNVTYSPLAVPILVQFAFALTLTGQQGSLVTEALDS